jgi:hypothetical protein
MKATYQTFKASGKTPDQAAENALDQATAVANSKGPQNTITVGVAYIGSGDPGMSQPYPAISYVAYWED